jgi:hypothetical protein
MDGKTILTELLERNSILTSLGLANLGVALLLLVFVPFNQTEVMGLNSLIKPIKFALSIAIYAFTMAWLLFYLQAQDKVVTYSWVAVIAMAFEMIAIIVQALRGQQSHFNNTSTFNVIIFALMGVFIMILTLWTAYMTVLFFQQSSFAISPVYVLAIRLGLVYFVLFSLFGGYIASSGAHTVGAADGGAGLPFVNWSKTNGDLRIAHFFGLHALQLIPLVALVCVRIGSERSARWLVILFAATYLTLIIVVMIQAFNGKPLLGHWQSQENKGKLT